MTEATPLTQTLCADAFARHTADAISAEEMDAVRTLRAMRIEIESISDKRVPLQQLVCQKPAEHAVLQKVRNDWRKRELAAALKVLQESDIDSIAPSPSMLSKD